MARKKIVCIQRRMKQEDASRHLSYVGVGGDGGWSEMLMVEDVLRNLHSPAGDRYFLRGQDGWEAELRLGKCPFCSDAHEFLCSAPDLTARDKLLSLPECGEP
jgi:hypothetical protein